MRTYLAHVRIALGYAAVFVASTGTCFLLARPILRVPRETSSGDLLEHHAKEQGPSGMSDDAANRSDDTEHLSIPLPYTREGSNRAFALLPLHPTAGQFLSAYYDKEWEAIRNEVVDSIDVTVPVTSDIIQPLDTISDRIRDSFCVTAKDCERIRSGAMRWGGSEIAAPDNLAEAVRRLTHKQLDEEHLAELEASLSSYDNELAGLADRAIEALDGTLQSISQTSRFLASPLAPLPFHRATNRKLVWIRCLSIRNWTIVIPLYYGDSPTYDKALADIRTSKMFRQGALRKYLNEHAQFLSE